MSQPIASPFVVAIDGPAGAGKSTVARALAARLGYTFLDTGALYRSVALIAGRRGIPWDDAGATWPIGELPGHRVRDGRGGHAGLGRWGGRHRAIRTPEISEGASRVSALPEVRAGLLDVQRRVAARSRVVAEGRDIGTVVFPDAQAKFFLVANPETRARRRTLELAAAGRPAVLADVLADMLARDARDSGRAVAPLRPAPDAVEIDTSALTPDAVTQRMLAVVRSRGG